MEAKGIVFRECERQAGFGYEPSWEDFVIAGQKAGIREAVEWINKNAHLYLRTDDKFINALQAKLKEWGE